MYTEGTCMAVEVLLTFGDMDDLDFNMSAYQKIS